MTDRHEALKYRFISREEVEKTAVDIEGKDFFRLPSVIAKLRLLVEDIEHALLEERTSIRQFMKILVETRCYEEIKELGTFLPVCVFFEISDTDEEELFASLIRSGIEESYVLKIYREMTKLFEKEENEYAISSLLYKNGQFLKPAYESRKYMLLEEFYTAGVEEDAVCGETPPLVFAAKVNDLNYARAYINAMNRSKASDSWWTTEWDEAIEIAESSGQEAMKKLLQDNKEIRKKERYWTKNDEEFLVYDDLEEAILNCDDKIIFVEGPSGCGKTTLVRKLSERPKTKIITSETLTEMIIARAREERSSENIISWDSSVVSDIMESNPKILCIEDIDLLYGKTATQAVSRKTISTILWKYESKIIKIVITGINIKEKAPALLKALPSYTFFKAQIPSE